MQPSARVEQAVPRSSPVISRKSPSSDIPRSSPVVTRRNPTTVDSQAKILGITEPLPQPNIVIETSEETEKQVCIFDMYACTCVCLLYVCVCVCNVCMYVCMYVCNVCMYVCMHVRTYVHMYVCM